jgi:hypothetical protein
MLPHCSATQYRLSWPNSNPLAVRTLLELLPKASVALLSWAKFNKPRLLYSYEQRKKKKKGGGKEKKRKKEIRQGILQRE